MERKQIKTLSIVIPAYNEEPTLSLILDKILQTKVSLKKDIIIIDDGSKDNTLAIARTYEKKHKEIRVFTKKNGGKGSAVKVGFREAQGEIIIIQDADLEYDPVDYERCITPIVKGKCKIVYGSRRRNKKNKKYSGLIFYVGGNIITYLTNILFFSRLTDEPTCYKTFRTDVLRKFRIKGNGFEWEPEITAKLLKKGIRICEVPISYYPRGTDEGKKINYKDFIKAIQTLLYYRVFK